MKKIFVLLALFLVGCAKQEEKPSQYVNSCVRFRASFINKVYAEGSDSVTLEIQGIEYVSFITHNDPCGNIAFQFRTLSKDTACFVPFILRTERDTLKVDMLRFSVNGSELVFK
jgi:hypothetical protein